MQLIVQADFSLLAKKLFALSKDMDDLKPVMGAIGGVLESSTRLRIAQTKTDADGKAWADLSDATKAAKGKRGSILVHRGGLLRSITHEASKNSVIVGSSMLYAKWHQEGTRNKDGTQKMPARPFLGMSADDYNDVGELLNEWLSGLIGA